MYDSQPSAGNRSVATDASKGDPEEGRSTEFATVVAPALFEWIGEAYQSLALSYNVACAWLSDEYPAMMLCISILCWLVFVWIVSKLLWRMLCHATVWTRTPFVGKDTISMCTTCQPALLDDTRMHIGNFRIKRFFCPSACSRCSMLWMVKPLRRCEVGIDAGTFRAINTYSGFSMTSDTEVHRPMMNILDDRDNFGFCHSFLTQHLGTLAVMAQTPSIRLILSNFSCFGYNSHTRSYMQSTEWIDGSHPIQVRAARAGAPPAPAAPVPPAAPAVPPGPAHSAAGLVPPGSSPPPGAPPILPPSPPPPPPGVIGPVIPPPPAPVPPAAILPPPPPLAGAGILPPAVPPVVVLPPVAAAVGPPAPAALAAAGPVPRLSRAERMCNRLRSMRKYWEATRRSGGRLPQTVSLSSTDDRLRPLAQVDRPSGEALTYYLDQSEAFRLGTLARSNPTVMTDRLSETPDLVRPPAPHDGGSSSVATLYDDTAVAPGPILAKASVHASSDPLSGIRHLEHRSGTQRSRFRDPVTGDFPLLQYKPNSDVARRLMRLHNQIDNLVFTDQAIDRAFHRKYGHKKFEEIAMSKFSKEQIAAEREHLRTYVDAKMMPKRKASTKKEIVFKDGKAGRLVVDNGLQLLATNVAAGGIFEDLIFGEAEGPFYDMSIKGRPRDLLLDKFVEESSDPWREGANKQIDTCMWEIDQTGMELHTRMDKQGVGILAGVYRILTKINNRIMNKLCGEFCKLHNAKIVYDTQHGLQLSFTMHEGRGTKKHKVLINFDDMYMDSGWKMTSAANYFNEMTGVFCSIVMNPGHLLAKNGNKWRLRDGTHDHTYMSVPLMQTAGQLVPRSQPIRLRGIFEGDDGAGSASRILQLTENGGDTGIIVWNQEQLGYSAKLKAIVDGRGEAIGAHFCVLNGRTDTTLPWVPDIKRYLGKPGCMANVNITPESTAARFYSLASMFYGRVEPLYLAFTNLAKSTEQRHKIKQNRIIRTDGYDAIDDVFCNTGDASKYTLKEIKQKVEEKAFRAYPNKYDQIAMLNVSVHERVDGPIDDWAYSGLWYFALTMQEHAAVMNHELYYSLVDPAILGDASFSG